MVNGPVVEVRHDSGIGFRWGPVLMVTLGWFVVLVGFAAAALTREPKPMVSLMFLTLAVAMAVLVAGSMAAAVPRRRDHLRVRQVDRGLEVVGSAWPQRSLIPAAVVTVAGAVIAVLNLTSGPDILTPTVLLVLCAAGASWAAIRYLAGRRPLDRVRLTRSGFSTRVRGTEVDHGWGDAAGFGVGKLGLVVEIRPANGGPDDPLFFPASELRSDPVLVAELLEFYRAHERLRGELVSGAVVERLRQGTFRPAAS